MLEGLAILVAIYGLILLLPACAKNRKIWEINQNCESVTGTVDRARTSLNMLTDSLGGTAYLTTIYFRSHDEQKSFEIYMGDHNLLSSKKYSLGDPVEVVYDIDAPYRAYPKLEWRIIPDDFRGAAICIGAAILLAVLTSIIK